MEQHLAAPGHMVVCCCASPSETELSSAWPALIAANNEAARELRASYLQLSSQGGLAAELSCHVPLTAAIWTHPFLLTRLCALWECMDKALVFM